MILVIVLSGIQLALDGPHVNPNSTLKEALYIIDLITTILFIMEALLKIVALGFWLNGPWSYIRRSYNALDFLIVLLSLGSLTADSSKLNSIKMLRVFRALRLISRNDGLRVAVSALIKAIPNVLNVTVIMVLFFIVYGVICVSFFKGKLFTCLSPGLGLEATTKWDCLNGGGEWENEVFNYDDLPTAVVSLFVMATTVGWAEIAHYTINASSEIDMLAASHAHPNALWLIFFVLFMLLGCFFFLNLFVGVVVSNFNCEHDKIGGNNLLTSK